MIFQKRIFRQRRRRAEQPGRKGHLIISGTGRAGTTFLVQYLTAAGYDTGFSLDEALTLPDQLSQGGLEHSLTQSELPDVIKSPWLVDELPQALGSGNIAIRAAIVPMRRLEDAAESRRRIHREASSTGHDPLNQPGTLWKTTAPEEQETQLALVFYRLMETLAQYRIPVYLLPFPALATDHDVLYGLLEQELTAQGISKDASQAAFDQVSRPALIHSFDTEHP